MKILLIHKFYHLSGGAERYVFEWERLLRERGHDVAVFAMRHPRNAPCAQTPFFVDEVAFRLDAGLRSKIAAAGHAVWSFESARRLHGLLNAWGRPDIVHLHSYLFQLTPSLFGPLGGTGAPIVQTCHDYAPVCVNQHLFNPRTGCLCEACLRYGPLAPLRQRCIKGSWPASAAGCAAGLLDRFVARSRRRVRRYIAPSAAMRRKLIAGGLTEDRVVHVPHFIRAAEYAPSDASGDYLLFFGRLAPYKGARTFLDAAQRLPGVPCRLLGGGPMEAEIREIVSTQGLAHVEVLGHREGDALRETVRNARAVVIPSEWHEPFGLVILEAMAMARPVIVTAIGGPPEIVRHDAEGLLVPPGDAVALSAAMRTLWENPAHARELGRRARGRAESAYAPAAHYEAMMRQFEEASA